MTWTQLLACCALLAVSGRGAFAVEGPTAPTVAPLPGSVTATQAYENPGLNLDRALSAFRQAPESVWLGLILLELEMQRGLLDEAQALATDLVKRFANERQVWAQRGYLMFMLQDYKQAQADFTEALLFQKWTPEQVRNLQLALANSGLAADDPQAALAALAPIRKLQHADIQLCLSKALLATGDRAGAATAAAVAKKSATTGDELDEAELLLHAAATAVANPSAEKELNNGYTFLSQHDDAAGLAAFQHAFAMGTGKAPHYADAAYAAKRLADNKLSIQLFRESLDRNRAEYAFDAQRTFGFRREIEVMDRMWGAYLGTPYQAGALDVLQGGLEIYFQPPKIGYRNGKTLQFFARGLENFRNGPGGPTGLQTLQASMGVRYKPFMTQNLIVTLERLIALGGASLGDWLLRLGYSVGGGTDLSVVRANWLTWQVFGEGAYLVAAERFLLSGEAHYGVTLPLSRASRLTFNGYPLVAADYDSLASTPFAPAGGAGVGLRYWFREDEYHSPASWLDFHVQYRFASAERAHGVLIRTLIAF